MTFISAEPFLSLSLRGARQGVVAISTPEMRRLLRFARDDISGEDEECFAGVQPAMSPTEGSRGQYRGVPKTITN